MRISGYSQEVRFRICKEAIMRHRELCDRIEKGERKHLYRSSEEIRKRKSDNTSWANTWFLKGATRSTISCPVTPGGGLKKELTKTVNSNKPPGSVLVIEDGGKPITSGLCVSDPLRPKGCVFGDTQCMVDPDFRCDTAGIIYKINCVECNKQISDSETDHYIGMTRTTVHARMLGHLKDQKSKLNKSHYTDTIWINITD